MNYEQILHELVQEDERFIVMTAENRAHIRGLPPKIGNRFIDVGICEQTMIGAAAGLALRGRIPVVHALATFLTLRAYEFIRTDVGISGLPVKICGFVPGFLSDGNGPTHQAIEDVSIMRQIPPVCVWAPADEQDMLIGLKTVLRDPRPFYFRYTNRKNVVEHDPNFEIGKAEMLRDGSDLTIATYGILASEVFQAAEKLAAMGINARVLNLRTVKPIDEAAILNAIDQTGRLVLVEDHFKIGGLNSIVAELCLDRQISPKVDSISLDGRWYRPATLGAVLEYEGFTADALAQRISNLVRSKSE